MDRRTFAKSVGVVAASLSIIGTANAATHSSEEGKVRSFNEKVSWFNEHLLKAHKEDFMIVAHSNDADLWWRKDETMSVDARLTALDSRIPRGHIWAFKEWSNKIVDKLDEDSKLEWWGNKYYEDHAGNRHHGHDGCIYLYSTAKDGRFFTQEKADKRGYQLKVGSKLIRF